MNTTAWPCGCEYHYSPIDDGDPPLTSNIPILYFFLSICSETHCAHFDNLNRTLTFTRPPGSDADSWYTLFRSGQWRLWYQLSFEGRQRYYNEMLPLLHHTKAEVLGQRDNDAYYLVYLGTKPHARGRGYARKLLQTMIDRVRS